MPVTIRRMRPDEAPVFMEVHRASVRGLAASHYSEEVIDAWAARNPPSERFLTSFHANPDNEVRLFAELAGEVVGLGVVVPQNSELRGCYVHPNAARRGVGSAIVREIERIARDHGVSQLHLDSSVNAEPFYLASGYSVVERGEHRLQAGVSMASVRMMKTL